MTFPPDLENRGQKLGQSHISSTLPLTLKQNLTLIGKSNF